VQLTDRVRVDWFKPRQIAEAINGEFAVSQLGTLSVAQVSAPDGTPFLVASIQPLGEAARLDR